MSEWKGQPSVPHLVDPWESGAQYQAFMGRWSRLVAYEFLSWLAVPENRRWIDVGCGSGTLSTVILEAGAPQEVLAIDPSPAFVAYTTDQLRHRTVRVELGSAQEIPADRNRYDAVVSGLVLNFIPDLSSGLAEMRRVVREGGIVAGYVWDYAGEMEMLRYFWDAVTRLDPGAAHLDEGRRFPLCHPDPLKQAFSSAGLRDIEIRPLDIATRFDDFEAYWKPFLGGIGPAGSYVAGLDVDRRDQLRDELKKSIPADAEGKIELLARAWAVRGVR